MMGCGAAWKIRNLCEFGLFSGFRMIFIRRISFGVGGSASGLKFCFITATLSPYAAQRRKYLDFLFYFPGPPVLFGQGNSYIGCSLELPAQGDFCNIQVA
jgi:hypothetical protein